MNFALLSLLVGFNVAAAEFIKPDTTGLFFAETFQDSPIKNGRLILPVNEKYADQPLKIESCPLPTFKEDKGLMLKEANKYYGGAMKFPSPLKITAGQDFVFQYEVMLTEQLTCGGAYLKLLRTDHSFDLEELTNETPYTIMFGPDKCGATNKVHFILQHQNPVNGEWEEKHFKSPPSIKGDTKPHVYTLHVKKDNTFEIYIDTEKVSSGSLLEDMDPPVNPSKMIDDPNDLKPDDWVDEAKIPDPEAVKPDDWDETAPRMILDMDAEKPSGWLDDEPEYVPDPEAEMPEDWDEEEDGEYEAPMVPNPKCEEGPGCGEWIRPEKPNPDYKGKWTAPMINNPAYKGEWAPQQIPNPHFFEDLNPHQMASMSAAALEIWTTNGGILLDNIVVADNLQAALDFVEMTWRPKHLAQEEEDRKAKKAKKEQEKSQKLDQGGFMNQVEVIIMDVTDAIVENPIPVAVGILVLVISTIVLCCSPSKPEPARRTGPPHPTVDCNEVSPSASGEPELEEKENASEEEEGEENETKGSSPRRRTKRVD
mmetsp:Transcript_30152/g.39716  ORF Transcript_30152/g.39716 Transcript_30152/m.39716 type:complete len:538 (+) Transcript_30152:80-1693(+)